MINLKSYQVNAVNDLLKETDRLIKKRDYRTKLVFKAPTGSGKTIVMGEFLNRFVQETPFKFDLPYNKFAFIWIAPNQLHIQSYEKIQNYFSELRTLRSVQFEDISDNMLNTHDILFLNWQSISSDDNVIIRENEQNKTLFDYIANSRDHGIEIIVILDEAHLFATRGDRANVVLNKINALIEIDVSATPTYQSDNKVVIHRDDVVKDQMIKKGINLNPALSAVKQHTQELDYYLLDEALKKRKEIAQAYKDIGANINPLLIIQLPSDTAKNSALDIDYKERIVSALKERNISTSNHKLAVWLSNEKTHLENIENFDNITEVLLFKQAIALGWDCPRAAVLLIFRELKQETFTIQTVGRILRMPEQKHYSEELLNIGYVYTNLSRDIITIVQDEMDYFIENKSVRIPEYQSIALETSHINKKIIRNRLGSKYKLILCETAVAKYALRRFEEEGDSVLFNINQMVVYGFNMDVDKIHIPVPKDIEIGEVKVNIVHIDKEHQENFAKTQNEIQIILKKFCMDNCGEFAKFDSAPTLEYALYYLFQVYFNIDFNEASKIILCPDNRQHFIDLINESFSKYNIFLKEKAKTIKRTVQKNTWEVPEFRFFNNKYAKFDAPSHVMLPTYLYKRQENLFADSKVEMDFIKYLEDNKQYLKWWYKNGDENKTDLSIDYINRHDVLSLFFIDFVILLKNDVIGLFDTKGISSDQEMIAKNNALHDYISDLNKNGRHVVGGIIVQHNGSWRYPFGKISVDNDVDSWQVFDIVNISKNKE